MRKYFIFSMIIIGLLQLPIVQANSTRPPETNYGHSSKSTFFSNQQKTLKGLLFSEYTGDIDTDQSKAVSEHVLKKIQGTQDTTPYFPLGSLQLTTPTTTGVRKLNGIAVVKTRDGNLFFSNNNNLFTHVGINTNKRSFLSPWIEKTSTALRIHNQDKIEEISLTTYIFAPTGAQKATVGFLGLAAFWKIFRG